MGKIPQEVIDQLLDRVDIVEVISGYIQLRKTGRNFKACCPFHAEKTPSFIVSPDKQIYHCFGCGAGGNALRFVMEYEKMGFREAVTMLAERSGVELPKFEETDGDTSFFSKLYEINNIAAGFYQSMLRAEAGKKALEYLKKRGLSSDTIGTFRIGYAPDEWEAFSNYCRSKKIPGDILKKAGLTVESEKNKSDYDRFRNRIIFPIFNEKGMIAAFGARVMDNSLPKYINSPETPVYSKSNTLYGLNFSKKGIRERGHVVIVEGYMDVIIPFQNGQDNIVAASGTALTQGHVGLLKRYTDTAVMVFDPDQAGEAASLRGLDVLISSEMNVRIATLPKGEDPDNFVRKNGPEAFRNLVEKAQDLFDYKLELLLKKISLREARGVAAVSAEMLPTIAKLNNAVLKSAYLNKLAERLGVSESSLREEIQKVKADRAFAPRTADAKTPVPKKFKDSYLNLLGLCIHEKSFFSRLCQNFDINEIGDDSIKNVMKLLEGIYMKEEKINAGKLLSRLEENDGARAAVVQSIAKVDIAEDKERVFDDSVSSLRNEIRRDRIKKLTVQLKKAQETKDEALSGRLISEINQLHKENCA